MSEDPDLDLTLATQLTEATLRDALSLQKWLQEHHPELLEEFPNAFGGNSAAKLFSPVDMEGLRNAVPLNGTRTRK